MAKTKYGGYFLTGPKPGEEIELFKRCSSIIDDDLIKGSHYFASMLIWPKYSLGVHPPHSHPYAEVILYHGLDPDNPMDLGGETELHLGPEFETHVFTQSTLVFNPPGMVHCPLVYRMKRTWFHAYSLTGPLLVEKPYTQTIKQEGVFERKYGKYLLRGPKPGERRGFYSECTAYLDGDVMPGAFHFATAFIRGPADLPESEPHTHRQSEILGFYGINPEDQFELGAELEISLGRELEKHTFDRSLLLYIPPGLVHSPLKLKKINRPFIFVECSEGPRLVENKYAFK
jgi:hypothetical protein